MGGVKPAHVQNHFLKLMPKKQAWLMMVIHGIADVIMVGHL
jgi:hypothetical protein